MARLQTTKFQTIATLKIPDKYMTQRTTENSETKGPTNNREGREKTEAEDCSTLIKMFDLKRVWPPVGG